MKEKDKKIIRPVYKELTDGYWGIDDARKYTSVLFPFVEPEQKVRDALKALNCKKDKDSRFQDSRRTLETKEDYQHLIRQLEYIFERESERYRKKFPEGERRDYRDIFMMLIPTLAAQKANISITLDVNHLNSTIYGECKECPIREICKEPLSVVTEYVSSALKKIDFEVPSEEE
jgi:hypothetical protein